MHVYHFIYSSSHIVPSSEAQYLSHYIYRPYKVNIQEKFKNYEFKKGSRDQPLP